MVVNGANKYIDLAHMKSVKEEYFPNADISIEYLDTRQLLAIQGRNICYLKLTIHLSIISGPKAA